MMYLVLIHLLVVVGRHHRAPSTAPTCYVYGIRIHLVCMHLCMYTCMLEVISYLIPVSYTSWYGWYDVSYY